MLRPARPLARPLALTLAAAFLTACAGQKEAAAPTPPAPAPQPAPAPAPAPAPSVQAPAAPAAEPPVPTERTERVSRMGLKIRFGIMPGNYDDDQDGVVVDDVFPGTSAADAGIQRGDRLMTWNGKTIVDVGNWMEHMAPHNPGDVVDIGVLRGGKIVPIKVTLKGPE